MSDAKRRSSNAIPLKRSSSTASEKEHLRNVKIECDHLREKIQKSVIDNPQTAKKAALLIGLWIEGKTRSNANAKKKAA